MSCDILRILPPLFHRAALDDCQLHLDNLRSGASALVGGVAPFSAITAAASLLDAAALAAAAARSAARAVGSGSSGQFLVHSPPNLLEESDLLEPARHRLSKLTPYQPKVGLPEASLFGPISISSGKGPVAETGITVRDLEEGIAGLARPSPSTPAFVGSFERTDSPGHVTAERSFQFESNGIELFKEPGSTDPKGHRRGGWSRDTVKTSESRAAGTLQLGLCMPDRPGKTWNGAQFPSRLTAGISSPVSPRLSFC